MSPSASKTDHSAVEICETIGIHPEIISKVSTEMPDRNDLLDLADLFKLFGDSTRIRILWALSESEMCVCDLCSLLEMKQPAVSHQLKNLKQGRIVKTRRDGKVIYYSLDDAHIRMLLNMGMEHIREA
ncbi:MAG: ArsR family transcriptional regulator [Desulfobacteraceae bacterium]|nr:MAG: ArsR family transcriptional regulator [Desulfobacteraceae bacterium]